MLLEKQLLAKCMSDCKYLTIVNEAGVQLYCSAHCTPELGLLSLSGSVIVSS